MERYNDWRDKSCGISPFLPIKTNWSLFSPFLIIIRIILLTILLPLLFVLPVRTGCHLLLLICGIKLHGHLNQSPGKIIVCNAVSPFDVIILKYLFPSARFSTGISSISFLSAFKMRFRRERLMELQMAAPSTHPVIIFPEATATNGQGVLSMSISDPINADTLVFLKYQPADISMPIPTFLFTFIALGQLQRNVAVYVKRQKCSSNEDVTNSLANLGRVHRLGFDANDKDAFMKKWQ